MSELFKRNKYAFWYNALIERSRIRPTFTNYTELHHIIPRSLGGNNNCTNVIRLTAREHYIAHLLLTKALVSQTHTEKMVKAAFMMSCSRNLKINSRIYQTLKENDSKNKSKNLTGNTNASGKRNIEFCKLMSRIRKNSKRGKYKTRIDKGRARGSNVKISIALKGRAKSTKHKEAIASANKGRKHSLKTKLKMSLSRKGQKRTPEQKARMIEAWKLRKNK